MKKRKLNSISILKLEIDSISFHMKNVTLVNVSQEAKDCVQVF